MIISNYGQERDINATDGEVKIFETLTAATGLNDLRMVRKSDNYVSAVLGDWDFARFKYTDRAKWIMFPCVESGSTKHRIQSPSDVAAFGDLLEQSIGIINHYQ